MEFPALQFLPVTSSFTGYQWKILEKFWVSLLYFHSLLQSYSFIRYSWAFSRLKSPSSFKYFLIWQTLQSLYHLYNPLLDSFQYVPVSLVPGSPDLEPSLQICLISAEQRSRIISLNLLDILLPNVAQLVTILPVLVLVPEFMLPRYTIWHFPYLNFMMFSSACLSCLLRSFWKTA